MALALGDVGRHCEREAVGKPSGSHFLWAQVPDLFVLVGILLVNSVTDSELEFVDGRL